MSIALIPPPAPPRRANHIAAGAVPVGGAFVGTAAPDIADPHPVGTIGLYAAQLVRVTKVWPDVPKGKDYEVEQVFNSRKKAFIVEPELQEISEVEIARLVLQRRRK